MNINLKNILISIGVIILTYMAFNITLSILKLNYTLKIVKEKSEIPLTDYAVYGDLHTVLKKYFRCIRNAEYGKLNDMSLFYAKFSNEEYKLIYDNIAMSELFEIVFNDISVLDENIYLCDLNIKSSDVLSKDIKVVVKLNREEGYFRILNFSLDGVI